MNFDDKYKKFPYFRSINHEKLGYIIKYEDENTKCRICKERTEWLSIYFKHPYCSEECLSKDMKEHKDEN